MAPPLRPPRDAQESVGAARRQALRMTVLTQVNIAYHRFERAVTLYDRFALLQRIETEIAAQTHRGVLSNAQTRLEEIRADASAVLATRARDRAYAEMQNAYGAIYQASGLDPMNGQLSDDTVDGPGAQAGDGATRPGERQHSHTIARAGRRTADRERGRARPAGRRRAIAGRDDGRAAGGGSRGRGAGAVCRHRPASTAAASTSGPPVSNAAFVDGMP